MPTYSLAELETLVWNRVESNTILYTQPEVQAVISEALRVTNLFSATNEGSVELPGFTVKGQLVYQTPLGMIFPTRVAFEGRDLDKVGLTRIGQDIRSWATDDTNNYGPVARWIPIGIQAFAIHPIDAVGGNDLTVTGVFETTPMTKPTDVMQLDDEFVSLISEYGGHRLVLKEAGKVFTDASVLIQAFWRVMKRLKRWQSFKAPRYFVQVQEPK
jgi:hypothetical protein